MTKTAWWNALKPGDLVYVTQERRSNNGMATVYSNAKKYIHIHLNGTPMKIRKNTGCLDQYPNFLVHRDEQDFADFCEQSASFKEALSYLTALSNIRGFRPTAADVSLIKDAYRKIIGEAK